tara:strand:+ start:6982 stop:8754 length:1773 start_codon:yes stop_codon:yes gene_type:complete
MKLVFDIECYINYFLIGIKNIDSGNVLAFEIYNDVEINFDRKKIRRLMENHTIIGANSENYDVPMVKAALTGASNKQLKKLSDDIIMKNRKYWEVERAYNLPKLKSDHIDIMNIAPGFGSLKLYGGRANAHKLQDLPIEPSAVITDSDREELKSYCLYGDLELTELLYRELLPQVNLRRDMSKQYNVDLMCKSDAQIAEALFKHELTAAGVDVHKTEVKPGTSFKYRVPEFIKFESAAFLTALDDVKESDFVVNDKGSVILPDNLKKPYEFGGAKYKMGIGGLHSMEKKQIIEAQDGQTLLEKDVKAYYPWIILNQNLYPKHLTPKFNDVYKSIVERRMRAKDEGDKVTDASLKIVINGSFGKFGSKYSSLYSPNLLIQTTITGQLSLMMLIERLTLIGVKVCSANTDGIVPLFDNSLLDEVEQVCFDWELDTGFELEDTFYKALYSRDVNNYLAVKLDDSYKGKGVFTLGGLGKNPNTPICYKAAIAYIIDGVHPEETIRNCTVVSDFTAIRTVNGGAVCNGQLIGKSIRWYYSLVTEDCIRYAKNNNKVPKTDGAWPMMQLRETIPGDLNYQWYIDETFEILGTLGYE